VIQDPKMKFENALFFARDLDKKDPLRKFRTEFNIPRVGAKPALYFTGNSLGLAPKKTKQLINEELQDWENLAVEGHFHSRRPWLYYHKFSKKALAALTGAKPSEVVAMNSLTVNLHLMLTSFYRPTVQRFKIIAEAGAFSSDQYAFESQISLHGLNAAEALIELSPRVGEYALRTEDIVGAIREHSSALALVIFAGVQYYSGQVFNIPMITLAAHEAGAIAGFDLAHAIGNIPLNLHKDNVDFAVWCSYKYLNAGPGGVAGAFVHERHAHSNLPRLAGWWGHDEKARFRMEKGFVPMTGVDGWQISNFPVLSGAALMASLDLFEKVGMRALRKKSKLLTGYLDFLLRSIDGHDHSFTIITPATEHERGCQLSLLMKKKGKNVFEKLTRAGIIADWREPNVIRIAPVPFYNSFEDIYRFAAIFNKALS
jgi:kynureninase